MNRKGFTLIELLGVIVIIGLVVGLSSFGIINVYNNSKGKSLTLTNESIKKAAEEYSNEKIDDINYWKKNNNNSYFCVTVIELINKGYLKKNKISADRYNDYVSVIKNNITKVIDDTVILSEEENTDIYNICNANVINEKVTKPEIKTINSFTDEIDYDFIDPEVETSITDRKCLYKDLSGAIKELPVLEDNKCQIDGLKDNTDYYELKACIITSGGTIVCSDPSNSKTKDLVKPTITVDNTVIVNFDDTNIKDDPSHYFKSTLDGNTTDDVLKCTLNNNIFTCEENSTNVVEKDVWYRTYEDTVSISYNESGSGVVTARVVDKSNNYKENTKEISVYNIKFMKGNADTIGNGTSDIDNYCVAEKNASCSITSPEAIREGAIFIGWNTNSGANVSTWDGNTSKQVNKDDTYYPIWNVIENTSKPVITNIINPSNGNWTSSYIILTINVTSIVEMDRVKYSYDQTNWIDLDIVTPKTVSGNNYTYEGTWFSERNDTVYFKAIDINGNESEIKTTPVKIDRTPPTFKVTLKKNGTNLASFTSNSYEYPGEVVDGLTIALSDVKDNISGIDKNYYFAWNGPYLDDYSETISGAEERTLTISNNIGNDSRNIELYGKRVLWLTLSDNAGNEVEITIKINIKNSKVSGNRFICDSSNLLSIYYLTGCPDSNPGYCNYNSLNGLSNFNTVVRNNLMTSIASQCIVSKVINTSTGANCRMGSSTSSAVSTVLYNCTPVRVAHTTTTGWSYVIDYGCYVSSSLIGDSCQSYSSGSSSGGSSGVTGGKCFECSTGSGRVYTWVKNGANPPIGTCFWNFKYTTQSQCLSQTNSCRCYKKNGTQLGSGYVCYNGYRCKKSNFTKYSCCGGDYNG